MNDFIKMAEDFNVDYDIYDLNDFGINHSVSQSISTESVYVTYSYRNKSVKVRYSNHSSNSVEFGDVLNGNLVTKNEILAHLGLKKRTFVRDKSLMIAKHQVKKREICNYQESELTIREMYALGVNADLSAFTGKLAKNSNWLIDGTKVEEIELYRIDKLGNKVYQGRYIYE